MPLRPGARGRALFGGEVEEREFAAPVGDHERAGRGGDLGRATRVNAVRVGSGRGGCGGRGRCGRGTGGERERQRERGGDGCGSAGSWVHDALTLLRTILVIKSGGISARRREAEAHGMEEKTRNEGAVRRMAPSKRAISFISRHAHG